METQVRENEPFKTTAFEYLRAGGRNEEVVSYIRRHARMGTWGMWRMWFFGFTFSALFFACSARYFATTIIPDISPIIMGIIGAAITFVSVVTVGMKVVKVEKGIVITVVPQEDGEQG